MSNNDTETVKTSEPVTVEWTGGLGDEQTVEVNPYTGKVTVNGRGFAIGSLCSDDVPDWMYRRHPKTEASDDE